jgi:hypothetical protein
MAGVQGSVIDTRKRLVDFPEGRALLDVERCAGVVCFCVLCAVRARAPAVACMSGVAHGQAAI